MFSLFLICTRYSFIMILLEFGVILVFLFFIYFLQFFQSKKNRKRVHCHCTREIRTKTFRWKRSKWVKIMGWVRNIAQLFAARFPVRRWISCPKSFQHLRLIDPLSKVQTNFPHLIWHRAWDGENRLQKNSFYFKISNKWNLLPTNRWRGEKVQTSWRINANRRP